MADLTVAEPASQGRASVAARIGAGASTLASRISIPLALALAAGALLRILLEASYRPAILDLPDSASYLAMADGGMFGDPLRTVGYPVFLDAVQVVSNSFEALIELQHVLGVATALLLYGAVRRVGAPAWAAMIAAAAVLLSLDQISLEHALAPEAPLAFVLSGALYAAIRGLDSGRPFAGPVATRELWLLAAGLLIGAGVWFGAAVLPLIPLLAIWVAFAVPGRPTARIARAAAAAAPAAALVLLYCILNQAATGTFGLIKADGWGVYARAAPFADCSRFTPPDRTRILCEDTSTGERPAPDFYLWTADSPARRAFGEPPAANDQLREFGLAAAAAQPLDFAGEASSDFLHHLLPRFNVDRPYSDVGYAIEIGERDRVAETAIRNQLVDSSFDPVEPVTVTGLALALADAQQLLRVHPLLLLQAALFAAVGFWFGSGRLRAAIALLGGSALLMLAAGALVTYAARHAIPVSGPLLAAGALGLWTVLQRYAGHGTGGEAEAA